MPAWLLTTAVSALFGVGAAVAVVRGLREASGNTPLRLRKKSCPGSCFCRARD